MEIENFVIQRANMWRSSISWMVMVEICPIFCESTEQILIFDINFWINMENKKNLIFTALKLC